jgi:hypothetical protein
MLRPCHVVRKTLATHGTHEWPFDRAHWLVGVCEHVLSQMATSYERRRALFALVRPISGMCVHVRAQ